MKGMYCLLLHHHLPFIKHPEFDYFMEEHWLFEALIESYIPLLATVEELEGEGVDFKFTVSLTPPLCEMLSDHTLRSKFRRFLHRTLELAEKEVKRTENDTAFHPIARFYLRRLEGLIAYYTDNLREDILARYRELQERGRVEIVTSACTHGLLPALQAVPEAVRTQLKVAVKNYRKHFHTSPKGIWLPECGYHPEVEEELRRLVASIIAEHLVAAKQLLESRLLARARALAPELTQILLPAVSGIPVPDLAHVLHRITGGRRARRRRTSQ